LNSPHGLGPTDTVYAPSGNASASVAGTGSGTQSAANQRYNYLIGRLRSRQITMEEATELFTLMQGMIARANELARAAAYRAPSAPGPTAGLAPPPPRGAAPSSADDLLLVGILAMGAGAGLLAALSRRMGDPTPPAPSGSGRSTSSTTPP
jgi:hypothetical protein